MSFLHSTGAKHDEESSKHHAKQQEQSPATFDQLEQQGSTDSTGMDAEAQQGGDLLDWENVQLPGVSPFPSVGRITLHCHST